MASSTFYYALFKLSASMQVCIQQVLILSILLAQVNCNMEDTNWIILDGTYDSKYYQGFSFKKILFLAKMVVCQKRLPPF